MPWVRLDDKFHSNLKIVQAGLEATGLYAVALSFCGDQLTDGYVPDEIIRRAGGTDDLVARLSRLDLWERVEGSEDKPARRRVTRDDGSTLDVIIRGHGYFIRDYLKMNPSRAEAQRRRSERSAAGRKGAQARWQETRQMQEKAGNSHDNSQDATHTDRIPPVPVPNKKPSLRDQRGNQPTCPECGHRPRNQHALKDHLTNVHWWEPDQIDRHFAGSNGARAQTPDPGLLEAWAREHGWQLDRPERDAEITARWPDADPDVRERIHVSAERIAAAAGMTDNDTKEDTSVACD